MDVIANIIMPKLNKWIKDIENLKSTHFYYIQKATKKKVYMTQKWFLLNEKKCLLLSAVQSEKDCHVDIICTQVITCSNFSIGIKRNSQSFKRNDIDKNNNNN